jgi:ubiquinol-cytochrome c reductase cytochrome b subunit
MLRATTANFLPILWLFFAVVLGMVFLRTKDARIDRLGGDPGDPGRGFYFIDAKFWGVLVMGGR